MIELKVLDLNLEAISSQVASIYTEAFPPDERRNVNEIGQIGLKNENFTFNLIVENKIEIGLILSWAFPEFVYLEHFAVDFRRRGKGIGNRALQLWIEKQTLPIILEVEPPANDYSKKRIQFYQKLGFRVWQVNYLQPPYSLDKQPVKLLIMSYGEINVEDNLAEITQILHTNVYGFID
jgi:GNAT superfamily N-acetyltransferase